MTLSTSEITCCIGGAFVGFMLGVLVMALAQVRTRADTRGRQGSAAALPHEGEGVQHDETLLRLRCLNASLDRVTGHLEAYAVRGTDGS